MNGIRRGKSRSASRFAITRSARPRGNMTGTSRRRQMHYVPPSGIHTSSRNYAMMTNVIVVLVTISVAIQMVLLPLMVLQRARVNRVAGSVLLSAPAHHTVPRIRVMSKLEWIAPAGMFLLWMMGERSSEWAAFLILCVVVSFVSWFMRSRGISRGIELRKNGVVRNGVAFAPWRSVRGFSWDPYHSNVLILVGERERIRHQLWDHQRIDAETILAEHVGQAEEAANAAAQTV